MNHSSSLSLQACTSDGVSE